MEQVKKTHWKLLINPDYIGAYSLSGMNEMTVQITKVVREIVVGNGGKKEECSVAYLQGQKPFILNRTNQKMISKVLGSPYIEDWAGHWITIYPTTTTVAGEVTECLRVRPTKPVLADISKEIEADISALNKCTTLSELQNVYKALKHKADNKVIAVKDKLKTELK